jgi:2-polyprenyl-3-methyl-5-hydroxy-6-metoxy-1,4-benzoquinol methylase
VKKKMRYSKKTTNDKNLLKRFVQRRRLADALSTLRHLDPGFSGRLLDFGAGGGELTGMLARRFPASNVVCYEPAPGLFEEAREDLAGLSNVEFAPTFEELKGRRFEYAFCLEVFEHLPPRQTGQAIRRLNRLLAPGGTLVVGVPNELFVPALAKGVFRMTRRYGAFDARPANVLKAALGRPPKTRPVQRIARGLPYHMAHTGFDHRRLEKGLSETFEPMRSFGSPIDAAPWLLSSEIYLVFGAKPR